MHFPDIRRSPRVLLCLLVFGFLWVGTPASAQDAPAKTDAAESKICEFNKKQAIAANGGPLGDAIWGRLCQVKDGKPTYAEGVKITVGQDGKQLGSGVSDAGGVFVIPLPKKNENTTYQVALDTETLPDDFSLTTESGAKLNNVKVKFGDQQVIFRMGEDTRGQRTFEDYATTFAKGIRLGLILGVAAVGLSLVFGVTGLVNFAHAELVTVGAVIALVFDRMGIPFWLAIIPAALLGAGISSLSDVAIWQPLRKRRMAMLSMMVVSIGLSITVRNLLQVMFGVTGEQYSAQSGQREKTYLWFRLTPNDVRSMAICIVVLLAMTYLLRRTRLGTAIRAVSDNPDLAASSGIDVNHIIRVVWGLCGALATIGGVLYGLMLNVKFDMGFVLLLSMFAAVVLGGLGSAYGAVLGALVVSVTQEMSGMFIDTSYKFVVAMSVLILVLLIRPQGILGKRERFG